MLHATQYANTNAHAYILSSDPHLKALMNANSLPIVELSAGMGVASSNFCTGTCFE